MVACRRPAFNRDLPIPGRGRRALRRDGQTQTPATRGRAGAIGANRGLKQWGERVTVSAGSMGSLFVSGDVGVRTCVPTRSHLHEELARYVQDAGSGDGLRLKDCQMPERRIGVIGLQGSGKTVLLTSLINHLMHHDPRRFPLGDGTVEVTHFVQELPDPGWDQFPYAKARRSLGQAAWPEKTLETSQYKCSFRWSGKQPLGGLTFYDLPGERFADLFMYENDYANWSSESLQELGASAQFPEFEKGLRVEPDHDVDREGTPGSVQAGPRQAGRRGPDDRIAFDALSESEWRDHQVSPPLQPRGHAQGAEGPAR